MHVQKVLLFIIGLAYKYIRNIKVQIECYL